MRESLFFVKWKLLSEVWYPLIRSLFCNRSGHRWQNSGYFPTCRLCNTAFVPGLHRNFNETPITAR